MNINESNPDIETEQNIQTTDEVDYEALFNASYSNNLEESSRLQQAAAAHDEADTTTPDTEIVAEEEQVDDPANTEAVTTEPEQVPDSSTDELTTLRDQLHRAKSDAGRVPHLNRRVQELERQLASVRTPASQPETSSEIPTTLKEKLERMREIDPEMAELIELSFKESASATQQVASAYQRGLDIQAQNQQQEHLRSEYQKVVNTIPEAEEVFRSQEWTKWVDMLSPNHRAMAMSSDANEVITAINAFKVDAENHFGGYRWGKPATPPVSQPQVSASAVAAENSRAARLANAPTVKATASRQTAELDAESLFNAAYNKTLEDNKRPY